MHNKSNYDAPPPVNDENLGITIDYPVIYQKAAMTSLTEDDVAHEFVTDHIENVRFDPTVARWYRWSGVRWQEDATGWVYDLIRHLCRKRRAGNRAMASDRRLVCAGPRQERSSGHARTSPIRFYRP